MAAVPYTKGLHEVGDGVFAWLQPDGGWGWSNAGLVAGDGGSLLVDTLFALALTREMLGAMAAVTATGTGFAAVGSHGNQPSAWTSADGGRTWRQSDLPLPVGSTRAALEHVASAGRVVVAVGTAVTTAAAANRTVIHRRNGITRVAHGVTSAARKIPAPTIPVAIANAPNASSR